MDMNFTKVTFESDLDEIEDTEELRGIVQKFQSAQDSNISEFEDAKETLEDFEGTVGQAQEFKQELAEDLAEVSPLSEEEALTYDMVRIRELIADFSAEEEETDDPEEEPENFSDFGTRGGTHDGEQGDNLAEEYLDGIEGLHF